MPGIEMVAMKTAMRAAEAAEESAKAAEQKARKEEEEKARLKAAMKAAMRAAEAKVAERLRKEAEEKARLKAVEELVAAETYKTMRGSKMLNLRRLLENLSTYHKNILYNNIFTPRVIEQFKQKYPPEMIKLLDHLIEQKIKDGELIDLKELLNEVKLNEVQKIQSSQTTKPRLSDPYRADQNAAAGIQEPLVSIPMAERALRALIKSSSRSTLDEQEHNRPSLTIAWSDEDSD